MNLDAISNLRFTVMRDDAAFVAIGILSAAGRTAKSSSSTGLRRREKIRESAVPFASSSTALRFLVANGELAAGDAVREEARTRRDILFVNMTEASHRCSLKYLLWLQLAPPLFRAAEYFVLADDDVYLQHAHLEADLRLVHGQAAGEHVLYGLIMWKPYFNNATLVTSTGFASWEYTDWAAVAIRRVMGRCAAAIGRGAPLQADGRPVRRDAPECYALRSDHMRAIMRRQVGAMPPFPYINGPMFALSRSLATLVGSHPLPAAYLAGLERQPRRSYYGISCVPVGDSVVGYWVSAVAAAARQRVTLVNTPKMRQHLPWPSWGFGNQSIVLHGLRSEKNDVFRDHAARQGRGAFVPFNRTCGRCDAMGWTTWPGTPLSRWRCCGVPHPGGGRRVAGCVGKRCPRMTPALKKLLVSMARRPER